MSSASKPAIFKRLLLPFLVTGGFLTLLLAMSGELSWSAHAAFVADVQKRTSSPTSCVVQVSSQLTTTYTTVQAGVDDAQPDDIVTVMGTCLGVEHRAGVTQTAYISKSLTLRGDSSGDDAVLNAGEAGRVLYITGGADGDVDVDVTVENLQLRSGMVIGNGAGLYVTSATLTLQNNVVVSHTASQLGGGIYAQEAFLTIDNTTFEGNLAETGGGAIFSQNSTLILQGGSQLLRNQALWGGGLYASQGQVTLNGIIASSHVITGHGGAFYLDVNQATVTDNTFSGNVTMQGSGGAVYLKASQADFSGNLVNHNQSTSDGGGFWLQVDELTLDDNTFTSNVSHEGRGGAIHLKGSTSTEALMSANIVEMNQAKVGGGGFSLADVSLTLLSHNQFDNNQAIAGHGGALDLDHVAARLDNNSLINNRAEVDGGALYASSNSEVTLENDNQLIDNSAASGSGGGLYLNGGHATINDNTIQGNSAYLHGGGYFANNESNTLNRNTFSQNHSETGHGGGLYVKGNHAALVDNRIEHNTTTNGRGGGMYVVEVNATISGSHIIGNQSTFGGGLFLNSDSSIVQSNVITGNSGLRGGGFFLSNSHAQLRNNQIVQNMASDGAGIFAQESSDALLSHNLIKENHATSAGGGLYLDESATSISYNQILSNTVSSPRHLSPLLRASNSNRGGGLFLSQSDATIKGNTMRANQADNGAGLYLSQSQMLAINNIIALNHANTTGSAFVSVSGSPIFLHTTFANNTGGDGRAIWLANESSHNTLPISNTLRMSNTILSEHDYALVVEQGQTAILSSTLWHNNQSNFEGPGTITTSLDIVGNPHFTNTSAGYYRLAPTSAAIDQGINAGIQLDIEQNPRPTIPTHNQPTGYDIGAHEYYLPDFELSYQATPSSPFTGEPLTYTIEVLNTGNVTLTASITATLPAEVEPTGSINFLTQTLPNQTWHQTIPVSVTQNAGTLSSMAQVTTLEGASDSQTITSSTQSAEPSLAALFYAPLTDTIVAGEVLTLNILLTNTGNIPLETTINATFPLSVTPNSATTWMTRLMTAPNEGYTWMKQISVTVDATVSGTLNGILEVQTEQAGISAQQELLIDVRKREPNLRLISNVSNQLTQKDRSLVYDLQLKNIGNTTLYSPTIRLETSPTGILSTDILTISRQPLLAGSKSWTNQVALTVTADAYQLFTTTVYVSGIDPILAETITQSHAIVMEANVLQVAQHVTPNPPIPGNAITYSWNVRNASQFVTLTATIEQILPEMVPAESPIKPFTQNLSPASSQTFTLTGRLANGCLSEPLTNTLKVTTLQGVAYEKALVTLPLHLAPTITATSGTWADFSIWNDPSITNSIPISSRVYIPPGVVVTVPPTIQIESLNNLGILQSQTGKPLHIKATTLLCNRSTGQIITPDRTKSTHSSNNIQLQAPMISNLGSIIAGAGITQSNPGGSVHLESDFYLNAGTLRAGNGGTNAEELGGMGGSITIISRHGQIETLPESIIRSGDGGTGKNGGGDGGELSLMARQINAQGKLQSGDGGDILLYRSKTHGGSGGDIKIFRYNQPAEGCLAEVSLEANLSSGDGGNTAPSSVNQRGGNGGGIYLMSAPVLALPNSQIIAGAGGTAKGTLSSIAGLQGHILISAGESSHSCMSEPTITLANSHTKLSARQMTIFGGDSTRLLLSDMTRHAISATQSLLLATGLDGSIDLRGNTSQIMAADSSLTLATSNLELPTGLSLADIAGASANQSQPQILSRLSLLAPQQLLAQAGKPLTISLALINMSPLTQTLSLSATSAALTDIQLPITTTSLSGNQIQELTLTLITGLILEDRIEIRAISQDKPPQEATLKIQLDIDEASISRLHFPLISR